MDKLKAKLEKLKALTADHVSPDPCVSPEDARLRRALRKAAEERLGPKPEGCCLLRTCNTRGCFTHVRWGTFSEQRSAAGAKGVPLKERIARLEARIAALGSDTMSLYSADGRFYVWCRSVQEAAELSGCSEDSIRLLFRADSDRFCREQL